MPYYQYRCKDCENEFETRQRMSDDPLTVCPVCNGRIRRVVSPVGVVFKGSGFYVTDARNGKSASIPPENGKTAESKPSEGEAKTASSEPAKTETAKTDTTTSSSETKKKETTPTSNTSK